jgi:hypothetical protein
MSSIQYSALSIQSWSCLEVFCDAVALARVLGAFYGHDLA